MLELPLLRRCSGLGNGFDSGTGDQHFCTPRGIDMGIILDACGDGTGGGINDRYQ